MNVVIAYPYRGERDQAFHWLENAIDERDLLVGHECWGEPRLQPLRGDPRCKTLPRRAKRSDPVP
jgi:hypothetical protein